MTTPTTAKKSTPATTKSEVKPDVKAPENTEVAEVKERIPAALAANPILAEFCNQFLSVFDEITAYNKQVLAEKDSEWNIPKVLEKARELGRPTDKNVKANENIAKALTAWEDLVNAVNVAKRNVLDATSKELGITLSTTAERNSETEAPMKERRRFAIEIGTQLGTIAKMTTNEAASDAVTTFLAENPLPAIGRDQARTFGADEKSTPKYRVNVVVTNKDGEKVVDEAGFTKAALALTKPAVGYERGKAPKSDTLREAWEKAGNSAETTVTNPVEFDDNNLHFVISKK